MIVFFLKKKTLLCLIKKDTFFSFYFKSLNFFLIALSFYATNHTARKFFC
jgi:hypothetical protein